VSSQVEFNRPVPERGESRGRIRAEIWILLALSLGRSGVYSIVNLIAMLTDNVALADQVTALNPSRSPRPYLDLTYQLLGIFFALAPVVLALYLLTIRPCARPLRETLGLDWKRSAAFPDRHPARAPFARGRRISTAAPRRIFSDLGWGLGLALAVGVPGLLFYALGRLFGITVQVQASALNELWWTIPVLILSAAQNGILEEFIVVGYLYERTRDLGWGSSSAGRLSSEQGAPEARRERLSKPPALGVDWRFLLASAALRGSYHLYQGIGPFFGNFAMGLLFAWWFTSRWGRHRVLPLVIAHTLLDVVAFVGYALAPPALLRLLGF